MVMNVSKIILIIGACLIFAFGCTNIQVQKDRKIATDIKANEKVSFIFDRSSIKDIKDVQELEEKIEVCIGKALKKLNPPIQTVSAEKFRNTVFPGLDYLAVPSSLDSLTTLLQTASFKERINILGLRYLLILKHEYSSNSEPIGGCVGGGAGGLCLAFLVWNNETKISATILDLTKNCSAGEVKAQAIGRPWVGIVLVFPLGFPAFSEGPACDALGKQVANFVGGNHKK